MGFWPFGSSGETAKGEGNKKENRPPQPNVPFSFQLHDLLALLKDGTTPGQYTQLELDERHDELLASDAPECYERYKHLEPLHEESSKSFIAFLTFHVKATQKRLSTDAGNRVDAATKEMWDFGTAMMGAAQDNYTLIQLYKRCPDSLKKYVKYGPGSKEVNDDPFASEIAGAFGKDRQEEVAHNTEQIAKASRKQSALIDDGYWLFHHAVYATYDEDVQMDVASASAEIASRRVLEEYDRAVKLDSKKRKQDSDGDSEESSNLQPFRVLDVGCGTGSFGKYLRRDMWRAIKTSKLQDGSVKPNPGGKEVDEPRRPIVVEGFDSSRVALDMLRTNVQRGMGGMQKDEVDRFITLYPTSRTHLLNLGDIGEGTVKQDQLFQLEKYDAVVSSDTLFQSGTNGFPGPEAVENAFNWVKPGGAMICTNSLGVVSGGNMAFYMDLLSKSRVMDRPALFDRIVGKLPTMKLDKLTEPYTRHVVSHVFRKNE